MTFLAPSQGLLPARAGSPLAGRVSHPLDDVQSFMKVSPPPIPFDQPCLVALFYLSVRVLSLVCGPTHGPDGRAPRRVCPPLGADPPMGGIRARTLAVL